MSKKEKPVDNVNHPKHYADGCCIECIDAMTITWGFRNTAIYCQINAYKYLWRFENKNGEEDLKKAEWYIFRSEEINSKYMLDEEIQQRNAILWEILEKAKQKYKKE